jgi:ATP-dependent Clp protease protease subunit
MNKYYSLVTSEKEADIYIFGDIVDPVTKELWGLESDTSGLSLVSEVKDLDVEVINVHINSYGGVVSEGLAIYNTLKNHKAKVKTYCDGFACSAASVVFMAGDERVMNNASLLMIHNAWMKTAGNAAQLRKDADDLEVINQASVAAYKADVNISEDELKALMDAETWITPESAVKWGFATSIASESSGQKAAASARNTLFNIVTGPKDKAPGAVINIDAKEIAQTVYELIKADIVKTPPPPADPPNNNLMKFFSAL